MVGGDAGGAHVHDRRGVRLEVADVDVVHGGRSRGHEVRRRTREGDEPAVPGDRRRLALGVGLDPVRVDAGARDRARLQVLHEHVEGCVRVVRDQIVGQAGEGHVAVVRGHRRVDADVVALHTASVRAHASHGTGLRVAQEDVDRAVRVARHEVVRETREQDVPTVVGDRGAQEDQVAPADIEVLAAGIVGLGPAETSADRSGGLRKARGAQHQGHGERKDPHQEPCRPGISVQAIGRVRTGAHGNLRWESRSRTRSCWALQGLTGRGEDAELVGTDWVPCCECGDGLESRDSRASQHGTQSVPNQSRASSRSCVRRGGQPTRTIPEELPDGRDPRRLALPATPGAIRPPDRGSRRGASGSGPRSA